jgi:hypothetical protein
MSTDYGEKERAFIGGLKEATGRDLAGWMAAIAAQKLSERNDIILWLRRQGFMFAKASWLERIHHNAGKPIYADSTGPRLRREPRAARTPRAATTVEAPAEATSAATPVEAAPSAPAPKPAPPEPPAPAHTEIEPLLAKAKAYRPLAQHVLAQIKGVRPQAHFLPRESFLAIADPAEFARLGVGPKELRLHLTLGEHGFDQVVLEGAPGGGLGKGEALTHMIVLTDARQVDKRLLDLVARAATHVNG